MPTPFEHVISDQSSSNIAGLIRDLETVIHLCKIKTGVDDKPTPDRARREPVVIEAKVVDKWTLHLDPLLDHGNYSKWNHLLTGSVRTGSFSDELRDHIRLFLDRAKYICAKVREYFTILDTRIDQSGIRGDSEQARSIVYVRNTFQDYRERNDGLIESLKKSFKVTEWYEIYSLSVQALNNVTIALNHLRGNIADIVTFAVLADVGDVFKLLHTSSTGLVKCIVMESNGTGQPPLQILSVRQGDDEMFQFKIRVYEMLTDIHIFWSDFTFEATGRADGGGPGGGGDRPEREVPRGGDGGGDGRGPAADGGGRRPERRRPRGGDGDEIEPAADEGERRPERRRPRDGDGEEIEPAADGGERRPERRRPRDGDGGGDGWGPAAGGGRPWPIPEDGDGDGDGAAGGGRRMPRRGDEPNAEEAEDVWHEVDGGGDDDGSGDKYDSGSGKAFAQQSRERLVKLRKQESDLERDIARYSRELVDDPDRAAEISHQISQAGAVLHDVQVQIEELQVYEDKGGDDEVLTPVIELSEARIELDVVEQRIGDIAREMNRNSQAIADLDRDSEDYDSVMEGLEENHQRLTWRLTELQEGADALRRSVNQEHAALLQDVTNDLREMEGDSDLVERFIRDLNASDESTSIVGDLREIVQNHPAMDPTTAMRIAAALIAGIQSVRAGAGASARLKAMRSSPGLYKAWLRVSLAESYPTT